MEYPIMEIFDSIQGEGHFAGTYVTFIRFAGCNLRCPWCDTTQSWSISNCVSMDIDTILNRPMQKTVVLTGGEPTIYKLDPLIQQLKLNKHIVHIETNGVLDVISPLGDVYWVTCSPKPPNYSVPSYWDELKYVVTKDFSLDNIAINLEQIKEAYDKQLISSGYVWLQPQEGYEGSLDKCLEIIKEHPYLRLSVQLHKLLNIK